MRRPPVLNILKMLAQGLRTHTKGRGGAAGFNYPTVESRYPVVESRYPVNEFRGFGRARLIQLARKNFKMRLASFEPIRILISRFEHSPVAQW